MIKDSVRIELPDKKDRELLLKKYMKGHHFDFDYIAKYLAGKTSFEIK